MPGHKARCPSCGAPVDFRSGATLLIVCGFCRSTLIRNDLDLESIGKMATLLADASPIQKGSSGNYRGQPFTVLGRIQMGYGEGTWNEWYVAYDWERHAWLGEAQGVYTITREVRVEEPLPPREGLKPGTSVTLNGKAYEAADLRGASCVACEGELPLKIEPGYEAAVVDLSGPGQAFATIDYGDDPPRVYIGETVPFETLRMKGLREPDPAAAPTAQARSFACPSCGSALAIRGLDRTEAVACGQCGSVIDAQDPSHKILSEYRARARIQPRIPLGTRGTFPDGVFEAIGFLRRKVEVEGVPYSWSEYLLFNPGLGFRWLTDYQGHWTLVENPREKPLRKRSMTGTQSAQYGGRTYKHFQSAEAEVTYVLGEFNWRVKVGEKTLAADYVCPPYILSAEESDNEIVWSHGEYWPPDAVWKAFQLPGIPPPSSGVFPCQPNPAADAKPVFKRFGQFSAAAAGIYLLALMVCRNEIAFAGRFTHAPGEEEKARVTEPFELKGRTSNVRIRLDTSLNQQWTYFNLALIDANAGTARNFGREVSRYYGVDDGESWSEGSARDTVYLGAVPAGRYYLRIEPEGNAPDLRYDVEVRRDVPRWSYLAVVLLLLAAPLAVIGVRWYTFENRRWAESDHPWAGSGGDDDDDDD